MQHAVNRGFRIAYDAQGKGPAVLLQHGLLSRRGTWHANGFVAALARRYTVVTVDSLGHGDSDKPADPAAYRRDARADDLAAVLDAIGAPRAHVAGYSMGGWIATGFAARHPHRLLSLTIGGWDPVKGRAAPPTLDFGAVLAGTRARAPELAAWITPDAEPGLHACWHALEELGGAEVALGSCGAPVLLWAGTEDPSHDGMRALATRLAGSTFRSVPGDHLEAMTSHAPASLEAVSEFLRAAGTTRGGDGGE
jgi:pimeloyl-ACP methyl ester carboxylesterase